ncbi:MAG: HAD-IB family hydrolase [Litorimonas sp.]
MPVGWTRKAVQRYAVFDLDETITTRGTWGRFVSQALRGSPGKLLAMWARAGIGQFIYKVGPLERISVKRSMLRWSLSGKTRAELQKLAEEFADEEVRSGLRPGAVRQIEAHRAAGDHILIASAGADIVVEAIAKRLGIKTVVSTKLAWKGEGESQICARHFGSENCYGPGKLDQLRKCLETFDDFQRESAHITMYTDSHSDLPVLKFADKGVSVNGDSKLLKAARVYGFETVSWSN